MHVLHGSNASFAWATNNPNLPPTEQSIPVAECVRGKPVLDLIKVPVDYSVNEVSSRNSPKDSQRHHMVL